MNIVLFIILQVFVSFGAYMYFRYKYIILTQSICDTLDNVISGGKIVYGMDLETQSSKIKSKLDTVINITKMSEERAVLQKQEVQQIISDISHQLRTPVSNILMYSDTLELSGLLGREERHFLIIIQKQVKKLEFLVQSLVKMSRLESHMLIMKKEMSPVYPVISRAISSILPLADKKNLEVEVHCPEELCLFFDSKWTEEAIFNVLDNAVKYTPDNGRIVVIAEIMQFYTKIQITDTGIGILPEHQCDIFKRFYREEKVCKEPGTGIGLYITKEILEKQGGYITVRSVPEKGSSFSIFLPNKNINL
ncbi:MAG: HAMP domain-containing histidine kinase [Lachnospiraceae bacterium]|nr:HAMP domain-containing histidine kinase [Lachnospiraceae bacterium]